MIVSLSVCKIPKVVAIQFKHVGFCIFLQCFLAVEAFRAFHTLNIVSMLNLFVLAVSFP